MSAGLFLSLPSCAINILWLKSPNGEFSYQRRYTTLYRVFHWGDRPNLKRSCWIWWVCLYMGDFLVGRNLMSDIWWPFPVSVVWWYVFPVFDSSILRLKVCVSKNYGKGIFDCIISHVFVYPILFYWEICSFFFFNFNFKKSINTCKFMGFS